MKRTKTIAVFTSSRSDYGLLRWFMTAIDNNELFDLRIIVSGAHLSKEQGYTISLIENDGFKSYEPILSLFASDEPYAIAKSIGTAILSLSDCLHQMNPDIICVLGDRYELLSICSTALVMNIPIAHISGGDVTEGAIDNEVRNAITMMSTLHFPGVEASAKNISRMLNTNKNIFVVGEPGIENFRKEPLMSRHELALSLGLHEDKEWVLFTYHPETKCTVDENKTIAKRILKHLVSFKGDREIVITKSNADLGGVQLNEIWSEFSKRHDGVSLYSSLGQKRYNSFMGQAVAVVGNSSSGIVEAPYFGVPVLNIGNRQQGRHLCNNIVQANDMSDFGLEDSFKQLDSRIQSIKKMPDFYWGDGYTADKILSNIANYLFQGDML